MYPYHNKIKQRIKADELIGYRKEDNRPGIGEAWCWNLQHHHFSARSGRTDTRSIFRYSKTGKGGSGMSEIKMVNFNPQKIYDTIAQIIGDRYNVDIKITVHPKETDAEAAKK